MFPTAPASSGTQTVTEEHLKLSLLSAVEDKMKWRLKETFAQAQVGGFSLSKETVAQGQVVVFSLEKFWYCF